MARLSKYRVLLCGISSPLAALFLYVLVYGTLTRYSADLEKDWLFRLSASTLAMAVPFFVTLALAIKDHGRHALSLAGKIGLVHRFSLAGPCLETSERRHPPLQAIQKPGPARRCGTGLRRS